MEEEQELHQLDPLILPPGTRRSWGKTAKGLLLAEASGARRSRPVKTIKAKTKELGPLLPEL